MNRTTFYILLPALFFFQSGVAQNATRSLKSLTWIEGNWRGIDGANPFYEIYKIKNDSTLVITSYAWDGKDSSKTSTSLLRRNGGAYFLGDNLNWKVANISESSIFMEPVYKAANTILWMRKDSNTWEAVLESRNGRKVYVMERVNHFPVKQ